MVVRSVLDLIQETSLNEAVHLLAFLDSGCLNVDLQILVVQVCFKLGLGLTRKILLRDWSRVKSDICTAMKYHYVDICINSYVLSSSYKKYDRCSLERRFFGLITDIVFQRILGQSIAGSEKTIGIRLTSVWL